MKATLYATFTDLANAEKAVGAMLDYGVKPEDVSLVTKRENEMSVVTPVEGETYTPSASRADDEKYDNLAERNGSTDTEDAAKSGISTTTTADAGAGAVKGAAVGIGVGAIAALVAIFVPGIGLVAGGGALATALAGAAATTGAGAITGAVTGYLKDQGMDSEAAERYAGAVSAGGGVVGVSTPSGTVDESTVRSILEKYGATNVTSHAATGTGGYVA